MPDGSWRKASIACPFYRHDSLKRKTITCEGVFDRSSIEHAFRRRDDRERQLELYCTSDYKHCEIYRAIMEAKYPED